MKGRIKATESIVVITLLVEMVGWLLIAKELSVTATEKFGLVGFLGFALISAAALTYALVNTMNVLSPIGSGLHRKSKGEECEKFGGYTKEARGNKEYFIVNGKEYSSEDTEIIYALEDWEDRCIYLDVKVHWFIFYNTLNVMYLRKSDATSDFSIIQEVKETGEVKYKLRKPSKG